MFIKQCDEGIKDLFRFKRDFDVFHECIRGEVVGNFLFSQKYETVSKLKLAT